MLSSGPASFCARGRKEKIAGAIVSAVNPEHARLLPFLDTIWGRRPKGGFSECVLYPFVTQNSVSHQEFLLCPTEMSVALVEGSVEVI